MHAASSSTTGTVERFRGTYNPHAVAWVASCGCTLVLRLFVLGGQRYSKAVLAKNGDKKQAAPVLLPTGRGGGGRPPSSGHAGMAPGPQRPSEQQVRACRCAYTCQLRSHATPAALAVSLQERTHWVTLVDFLRKRSLLPVVAFTFSKRRCESNAAALANIELTTGSERSEIQVFVDQSLKRLKGRNLSVVLAPSAGTRSHECCARGVYHRHGRRKGTDRELPQVGRTRSLLLRGLAVHHGGLLPIIKEVTCEGRQTGRATGCA